MPIAGVECTNFDGVPDITMSQDDLNCGLIINARSWVQSPASPIVGLHGSKVVSDSKKVAMVLCIAVGQVLLGVCMSSPHVSSVYKNMHV